MSFAVTLRSGSSGNCTLISNGQQAIVVDCGMTCRQLTMALKPFGLEVSDLSGVVLTHEHSDHTGALSAWKRQMVPIYGSKGTLCAVAERYKQTFDCRAIEQTPVTIGGMHVRRFNTSHDAAESCGYTITMGALRIGVCTDLGEMTSTVLEALRGCDYVVLECNYDVHMLRCSRYPLSLRRRIASRLGHLSNDDCGLAVVALAKAGVKRVTLAHLSEENNEPSLALGTVIHALLEANIMPGEDFTVDVAPRYETGIPFHLETMALSQAL